MPETSTPITIPTKAFVFVEDGQNGIQTRVFMSRAGAEQALIAAALEYEFNGKPIFTKELLELHARVMREAMERGETHVSQVIECLDMGSLWINVVDVEA